MKTLSDYTIYCTPEQTKKALELGAPVEELDNEEAFDVRRGAGFGFPTFGRFEDYLNKEEYPDVTIIEVEDVRYAYLIPTAEQMIGWIEEQEIAIDIHTYFKVATGKIATYQYTVYDMSRISTGGYSSLKETTLAAIDAALEYLTNKK